MADVVDKARRSRMMSAIRGKNTKPELIIRKGLFAKGFRYRLHAKGLPGKPDLALRRYNAAIFVNGCFWHGHRCRLFKWPETRAKFWRDKIQRNEANDARNVHLLRAEGWRVLVVWECALKGKPPTTIDRLINRVARWLRSDSTYLEIADDELPPDLG